MNVFVGTNLLLDDRTFLIFWYRDRFLINVIKVTLPNRSPNITVGQLFHQSLSVRLVINIRQSD